MNVKKAIATLTPEERTAQYVAAITRINPRERPGYEKVKHLYTEHEGTRMKAQTEAAFIGIITKIINKEIGHDLP